MSIRRKTCETMTLLYEAALKTIPGEDDQSSDRPDNVNPTAGVTMREKYGRSVFVPDPSRPGGGIWVAQTQDEKDNAGPQPNDIVLASDYQKNGATSTNEPAPPASAVTAGQDTQNSLASGPGMGAGAEYTAPTMDVLQGMQMTATNVNPNINIVGQVMGLPTESGMNPGQDVSHRVAFSDQTLADRILAVQRGRQYRLRRESSRGSTA